MEVLVESGGHIYDITEMCKAISWTDMLNEGSSILEVSYIRKGLILNNGDIIRITGDTPEEGIFFGMIRKTGGNKSKIASVKAYDQLFTAKSKDIVVLENGTLRTLVLQMGTKLSLKMGTVEEPGFILKTIASADKTWLDLTNQAISDTLIGSPERDMYCLRDEFGSVCLWNMRNLQLPLVLGDDSLCTDYEWEKSIADDYYNRVKVLWKDENSGKMDMRIAADQDAINRFGFLQYLETAQGIDSAEKAQERANNLLKLYNHETETLKFDCLGDLRVRAGNSIFGSIEDIGLNRRLIVKKVTHSFLPVHTMNVEVMTDA